jgi:hypothetical protein
MFRRLDAIRIVDTARRLQHRIEERFPGSGLSGVARDIVAVADDAMTLSHWLARPHRWIRAITVVGSLFVILSVVTAMIQLRAESGPRSWSDWVQSTEAFVNDLVFVGIAVYFLLGLEVRWKRARAVGALHVLRSLAHIIDMHQLTKDPDRTVGARKDTASSPRATLSAFELTRYLDYCSELLAIVSKIAALYVQELADPPTVAAASAVEELCVGLSRTIWQKIVILDRVLTPHAASPRPLVADGE